MASSRKSGAMAPDFLELAIKMGNYMWENLFPAFIAFGIAILALAMGLSTLLTREEG